MPEIIAARDSNCCAYFAFVPFTSKIKYILKDFDNKIEIIPCAVFFLGMQLYYLNKNKFLKYEYTN